MEKNNFFQKNKTLFVLFAFCSVLLIILGCIVGRGLFYNIPSLFASVLEKHILNAPYFFCHEVLPVNFSNRLLALPYNFFCLFANDNPFSMINLYYFSCSAMVFAATILNFFIAKRTNKYEFAALALFFYSLFAIPASAYIVDTTYFAIPMFFILLQYFFTEEKLYKFDYLFIILISAYFLQSSPNIIIPLLLFSVPGLAFLKQFSRHRKVKAFICLSSLCSALYMIYKTFFFTKLDYYICPTFQDAFSSFQNAVLDICNGFFVNDILFSAIALVFLAYVTIRKKCFSVKDGTVASLVSLFALYSVYEYSNFAKNPFLSTKYYAPAIIALTLVVLVFLFLLLLQKKYNKENLCNNLIAVACLFGIIHCVIQYGECLHYGKYVDFIKSQISNQSKIIQIKDDDYSEKSYLIYDSCNGSLVRSLIISDYDLNSILIPGENLINQNKMSLGFIDTSRMNETERPFVIIQDSYFPLNNKYWNLYKIIPLLEKLKKSNN